MAPDVGYEEGGQGPDVRSYRDGRRILAVEMLSLFQWPDWAKEACRHAEMTDRLNKMLKPNGYFLDVDVAVQDPSRSPRLKILTERAQAVLAGPAGSHGRLPERPAA